MHGVLLESMLDRAPLGESSFELADCLLMPLVGGRPSIQDVRAPFREFSESVFEGQQVILPVAPFADGKTQLIDLSLKVGSGLFHSGVMIHKFARFVRLDPVATRFLLTGARIA
jgi:hypothetical protein